MEGQTESLQKEWSSILDEKQEETGEKCEDVKIFEEDAANKLITPRIGRNSSLTDDTVDQTNGDQCDVVVYDRGKLKEHIRRIHEKGHCDVKQVRARGYERGRRIRDDRHEIKKERRKNSAGTCHPRDLGCPVTMCHNVIVYPSQFGC